MMLNCEGYKMFFGTAEITPRNIKMQPWEEKGTWLFRPDTGCWYVNGRSFPVEIVGNFKEEVIDSAKVRK